MIFKHILLYLVLLYMTIFLIVLHTYLNISSGREFPFSRTYQDLFFSMKDRMHLLACLLASIRPRTSPTKFQVSFPPRQFSFILISHRSIFIDANANEVHGMFSSLHGVRHCFLDSLLLTELLERADLGRPETRRPYGMWNAQFIRGD